MPIEEFNEYMSALKELRQAIVKNIESSDQAITALKKITKLVQVSVNKNYHDNK